MNWRKLAQFRQGKAVFSLLSEILSCTFARESATLCTLCFWDTARLVFNLSFKLIQFLAEFHSHLAIVKLTIVELAIGHFLAILGSNRLPSEQFGKNLIQQAPRVKYVQVTAKKFGQFWLVFVVFLQLSTWEN